MFNKISINNSMKSAILKWNSTGITDKKNVKKDSSRNSYVKIVQCARSALARFLQKEDAKIKNWRTMHYEPYLKKSHKESIQGGNGGPPGNNLLAQKLCLLAKGESNPVKYVLTII